MAEHWQLPDEIELKDSRKQTSQRAYYIYSRGGEFPEIQERYFTSSHEKMAAERLPFGECVARSKARWIAFCRPSSLVLFDL